MSIDPISDPTSVAAGTIDDSLTSQSTNVDGTETDQSNDLAINTNPLQMDNSDAATVSISADGSQNSSAQQAQSYGRAHGKHHGHHHHGGGAKGAQNGESSAAAGSTTTPSLANSDSTVSETPGLATEQISD